MNKKSQKSDIIFREALKLYAIRHNNKVLDILMRNFDIRQVAKLILLFSNEWIRIPDKKKISLMYRNKRIRDELDRIDPHNKLAMRNAKQELATFFSVSLSRIAAIYTEEVAKSPGTFDDVDKIAAGIYREEFINFQKEVEDVLKIEHISDGKTKVPIIPY